MGLQELLAQRQKAVVTRWIDGVVASYPPDTSRFLKSQKDGFANPVGHYIRQSLTRVFADLLAGAEPQTMAAHLDPLVRIRAVQPMFAPSEAIGFIFDLKPIVRAEAAASGMDPAPVEDLAAFEQALDRLALAVFDLFTQCREKVYALQASTERDKVYRAFARAGLVREIAGE